MSYNIFTFFFLFLSPLCSSQNGETDTIQQDYPFTTLVWHDEFDKDGAVDPDKWFHQVQLPTATSWHNNEIQHYTDRIDNSFVSNGTLKIKAIKEEFTDQGVTKQYTSARLNSKFAFTYGRVEIRAKLPSGEGTWPAIWTLGQNITERGSYWQKQGFGTTSWPACGEIDIVEHWGTRQNYVQSATHTPAYHGDNTDLGGQIINTASSDFHIYTLIWTEEELTFFVDGMMHHIYHPQTRDSSTWPFYKPQYLLLNLAILPIIEETDFAEGSLEIDYIRIYQ